MNNFVEFTNRSDFAFVIFQQLCKALALEKSPLILGVGSLVDAPTAAMYIGAGANFIVGSIFSVEVAKLCNRRKITYIPGCGTVDEISEAEEFGTEIRKLLPGTAVGTPGFIKAIKGPCHWTSIMPTGSVEANEKDISMWIKGGIL